MRTFQPGDVVWTEEGRKASYVSAVGHHHAIKFAYNPRDEDNDEEYFASRIETVDQVFAAAPVEVVDAEIAKRQAKLDDLTTRALEKSRELVALDQEQKGRMAYLQQHEELRQLEAWLSGKITHFVTWGGHWPRVHVLDWDAALAIKSEYGDHRTGTAVLTLKVGWDKKLTWAKTERPAYEHLRPHTSLEDALADAARLIGQMFAGWNGKVYAHRATRHLIADAKALDIPVPQAMTDAIRDYDIKAMESEIKEKQTALDLAAAKLAAMRETVNA